MISTIALFWALCVVCVVNMARYFSSLRALLVVLRGCDPLLYQYVDGGGFFTSHGQPSKQMRLVWYIYAQRYRDHHDDEFIRRCERVRRQFILTSALCGLVVVSLIALDDLAPTFQNKTASKLARFERITLKSVSGRASKGRLKG